ncbi:MAG: glycosyltransferase family 2 protein [Candidatus Aureabacteria bacterium]|nr:glycosyltransferase family 2 protein [Candidatus Auribacterota bacterium]
MQRTVGGGGPAPQISVVIPTWNGIEHLEGCLSSLERQTFGDAEVILVDNASRDGSVAQARERHPSVAIVENPRNLGFARAVNAGCAAARGGLFFILNNDTVLDPGCLGALARAAGSHPEAAILAPKILFLQNPFLVNSAGVEMNLAGYCWDRGFDRADAPRWDRTAEVLGASGGAMLVRREEWEEAGGFDPGFGFYCEDMDLCLRVCARGRRILYIPEAVVYHKFSASSDLRAAAFKEYRIQRNRLRLLFRNVNMLAFSARHPSFWVHTLGSILAALAVYGEPRQAALKLRALCANLVRIPAFAAFRIVRGRRMDARTRALIIPRIERPLLPRLHRLDYEEAHAGTPGLPSRLMVGVNDFALGHGWYPRERVRTFAEQCRGGALHRWFGKKAVVFLSPPAQGNAVLRIHAHFPRAYRRYRGGTWPALTVRVDGREAARFTLSDDWCTLTAPVRVEGEVTRVECEVDRMISPEDGLPEPRDLGLAVNEISLFPAGSVFLGEPV